jgi:hypothetical protein
VQWECDAQHGIVDGRCAECLLMAQAASNLNVDQIEAIRAAIIPRRNPMPSRTPAGFGISEKVRRGWRSARRGAA